MNPTDELLPGNIMQVLVCSGFIVPLLIMGYLFLTATRSGSSGARRRSGGGGPRPLRPGQETGRAQPGYREPERRLPTGYSEYAGLLGCSPADAEISQSDRNTFWNHRIQVHELPHSDWPPQIPIEHKPIQLGPGDRE